jgi:hypothetical protein
MAVKEDVNIKVSADMAEALQAWKDIENGPKALEEALKRISDLEQGSSTKWASALEGIVGKWLSIAAAIKLAKDAAESYFATQQKISGERVENTRTIDAAFTASLGVRHITRESPAGSALFNRVRQAAVAAASTASQAFATSDILFRQGGDTQENLIAMLGVADVSKQLNGPDPSEAIASILRQSGGKITPKRIEGLGGLMTSLLRPGVGANLGMIDEYNQFATQVTGAGFDEQQGLSMWVALRSKETNMRRAGTQFRSLFDADVRPGEAQQLAGLQSRGAAMVAAGGGDYQTLVDIVGGSMATREQRSETSAAFGRYTPGVVGRREARNNLVSLLESMGIEGTYRGTEVESVFDNPWGPDFLGFNKLSMKTTQAAYALQRMTTDSTGSDFFSRQSGAKSAAELSEERRIYREQIMGQREIVHRFLGPDGRDVPVQTEGEALNQDVSNDATQSANFRSP